MSIKNETIINYLKNCHISIETDVPLDIFEEESIKGLVDSLFINMNDKFKKRCDEIIKVINMDHEDYFSYEVILPVFKFYFLKYVANYATNMCFSKFRYNIKENIISLLTEDTLKNCILCQPLIDAFSFIIKIVPSLNGGMILLLRNEFLYNQTIKIS